MMRLLEQHIQEHELTIVRLAALADFDVAVTSEPPFLPAYYLRATLYLQMGEQALARQDYERYLELAPASEYRPEIEAALQKLSAPDQ